MSDTSLPLATVHARAIRLYRPSLARLWPRARGQAFAPPQMIWPALALYSRPEIAVSRHVLAQRVVAGTMTVFPPVNLGQPSFPVDVRSAHDTPFPERS